MMHQIKSILFLFVLFALYRETTAQWLNVSPPSIGYGARAMTTSGKRIILSSSNTAAPYVSTDSGSTWNGISGLSGMVTGLTSGGPDTAYACTGGSSGGLYVSTDAGQTWKLLLSPPESFAQTSLVVGSTILVGCNDGTIFRSTDGGVTATKVYSSVQASPVTVFTVLGSRIFGAGDGIYQSSDNGITWSTNLAGRLISGLTVHNSTLFANFWGTGIYKSTDNGSTWNPAGVSGYVYELGVIGNKIYAGPEMGGLYVSTDDGAHWNNIGTGLGKGYVQFITTTGHRLIAATESGIYTSDNDGTTWVQRTFAYWQISSAFFSSKDTVLEGSESGMFLSPDNGISWFPSDSGLTNLNVSTLFGDNGNIFAGTSGGVFISRDNGYSWYPRNNGLTNLTVNVLISDSDEIIIGTDAGVFLTTDRGTTWNARSAGLGNDTVNALTSSSGSLFAGTPSGIYVSTDDGLSWSNISSGLTLPSVLAVAARGDTIFAGGYQGIFLSTDAGHSWQPVLTSNSALYLLHYAGPPGIIALSISHGDTVFAGSEYVGVLMTTDCGSTWMQVGQNRGVQSLTVSNGFLFAPLAWGWFGGAERHLLSSGWNGTYVTPPSKPKLVYPSDNAVLSPKDYYGDSVRFVWHADGAKNYNVWFMKNGTTVWGNGCSDTSIGVQLGNFSFDSIYRWYVQANNDAGYSTSDTSSFKLLPWPSLALNAASLNFGSVRTAVTFTDTVKITNASESTLSIDSIYTKTKEFQPTVSSVITAPYDTAQIGVSFTPDSIGTFSDTLYLRNNSQNPLVTIPIFGSSPAPYLTALNSMMNFGTVGLDDTASMRLHLFNGTLNSVSIISMSHHLNVFFTTASFPHTISANDTFTLQVYFKPLAFGNFVDTLTIQSNGGTAHIPLSGISPYPTAILSKTASSFPSAVIGTIYRDSLSVKDTTINKLTIDSAYTRTRWFTAGLSKDTCGLNDSLFARITFTPDSARSYTDTLYLVNNSQTPLIKIPLSGNVPAPVLSVPAAAVALPQSATTDSSSLDVTIHDPSINPLTVSSLSLKTNAFHIRTALPLTVQGKDSAKVHIVFLPQSFGTFNDTLSIVSNGGNTQIPLSATSPYPIALVSRNRLDYGMVSLGTGQIQNIVVRDSSINALSIDTIYTKTKAYKVSLSRGTVKPADSLTISMTFTPDTTGDFNDTLYIRNNSQTPLYRLPLSGSSPMPEITVTNVLSAFTAKAGQSGTQSVRFTNSSINVLVLDSAQTMTKYFRVTTTFPDTVIKGDTASIQIGFLPDSVRSYTDTLYVYSNAGSPTVIALSGTGSTPTGILREGNAIPTVYELYQNYPNPFNPTTTIKFALPTQSQVSVTIYDILGREVKELVNDKLQAGYYHFTWDATRFASGVYFYRIEAQSLSGDKKSFVEVKKLLLLK